MVYTVLGEQEIADLAACALNVQLNTHGVPIGDDGVDIVECLLNEIIHVYGEPFSITSRDLTASPQVFRDEVLKNPVDSLAKSIASIGSSIKTFVRLPLPGGVDMKANGQSDYTVLRFVRAYDMNRDMMLGRLDCAIVPA